MANSSQFVTPSITTPASNSLCTAVPVYGGLNPRRICEPAVVSTPRTHSTSLTAIGMPVSGPAFPALIALSAARACSAASGSVRRRNALTSSSADPIRSR